MKKTIFLMLFAIVGWQYALAQSFTSGGLKYNITSTTTVEVANQNRAATGSITIPDQVTYNSTVYAVTGIGDSAFAYTVALTSVVIPSSVTIIGPTAFRNCSRLTSISIPNTVTSLGSYSFYGCSSLPSIALPNAVTSIGAYAFTFCSSLTSITIPNQVTAINEKTFFYCSTLATVNLPSTITSFGNNAFENCFVLSSFTIPTSLTSMGYSAFCNCYALTSLVIPNAVTSIGNDTFRNCRNLTTVTLGNATTSIGDYAFSRCTVLTSIAIPSSVTNIGASAFSFCSGLTSASVPNLVTTIKSETFYYCSNLTSVTLGNSITSIGTSAFENCSNLASINIPNALTTIGDSAFASCYSLTSAAIPNTVNSIGEYAYYGCSGLTTINIPNAITSIATSTFESCSNLSAVTIPNAVTTIGDSAFSSCSNLTTITIPNTVTNIGNSAFYGCSGLALVVCNITVPLAIDGSVFEGVNQGSCSLAVPSGGVADYQATAVWQNFMVYESPNIPTTKVRTSQCGVTLAALNTDIMADKVANAPSYRFKIESNGTIEVIDRGLSRFFNLTNLTNGAAYNTAYTISVAVKKDGVWGDYGNECVVTTPALPETKVRTMQCGATLAALNTDIMADWLQFATEYRFKVVNGANEQVIERGGSRFFNLTALTTGAAYNTAYTISVAVKHNGVWGDYGTACVVTTPAAPTTKVQTSQCGATLAALNTDVLANWLQFATEYRFKVVANGAEEVINRGNSRILKLTALTGGATAGTTYTVSVAVKHNGVWGDYGTECTVRTPGSASNSRQIVENTDFSLVAYPNPSNSAFKIEVNGANDSEVSILVFDMMGRQIENKVVKANDFENISLGQNYSTGVYNVIVSQGMNTKTVRLVKR